MGQKLYKKVIEGTKSIEIYYLDGFQYRGAGLQFFPTAEGYVRYNAFSAALGQNPYAYVYQYKDHLGNVRMDFARANNEEGDLVTQIKEENHYYPFGLKHENYNTDYLEFQEADGGVALYPPISVIGNLPYNYKYNSKEHIR